MTRFPERNHPEGSDTPFGFGSTDWLEPMHDDQSPSRIEAMLNRDIRERLTDDQIDLVYGPGPFPHAKTHFPDVRCGGHISPMTLHLPDGKGGVRRLDYTATPRPSSRDNVATSRYLREAHGMGDDPDFPDADAPAEQIVGALNELIGNDWIAGMTGGRRCDGERTLFIELSTKPEAHDRPEP